MKKWKASQTCFLEGLLTVSFKSLAVNYHSLEFCCGSLVLNVLNSVKVAKNLEMVVFLIKQWDNFLTSV